MPSYGARIVVRITVCLLVLVVASCARGEDRDVSERERAAKVLASLLLDTERHELRATRAF